MKKLFLLIAVLAVCAAAHFARPQDPRQSFSDYLAGKTGQGAGSGVPVEWTAPVAHAFADQCTYDVHPMWVNVRFDDQAVYTNVFGHWFSRAEVKKDFQANVEKARVNVDHAADKLEGK